MPQKKKAHRVRYKLEKDPSLFSVMQIPFAKVTYPNQSTLSNGIDGISEYIEAHRKGSLTRRKFSVSREGLLGALMHLSHDPYFTSDNPKLCHMLQFGCRVELFGLSIEVQQKNQQERVYVLTDHKSGKEHNVYTAPMTNKGMAAIVAILTSFSNKEDWRHEEIYEYF